MSGNSGRSLRAVTYNVHRCRGMDLRKSPARIVEVLREIDGEVIALQEVLSRPGRAREQDQARFIAEELGLELVSGTVREVLGGLYGNVILSRYPVLFSRNFDISIEGREERGCLRADLDLGGGLTLHVFNVHLGTGFFERRAQAEMLTASEVLEHEDRNGPRLVLGDFNEWTSGLVSRMLSARFESFDVRSELPRARTYPGVMPLLHLDHVYYDPPLKLREIRLHRTRTALWASDHLPLAADFDLPD